MAKIMLVDDERLFCNMLSQILRNFGHEVATYYDGANIQEQLLLFRPDLLILDISMPRISGLEILKNIRNHNDLRTTYVMLLTAKTDKQDIINGLNIGADEYITKPFELDEFTARVNATIRQVTRRAGVLPNLRSEHELHISTDAVAVYVDGDRLPLTPVEFNLLLVFAKNFGCALSREYLANQALGPSNNSCSRTIDTHINNLRKKLCAYSPLNGSIKAVRGIGYSFEPPHSYPVRVA
ncbi:MAG: response regulator transcription factor [Negativicutes bacterium]